MPEQPVNKQNNPITKLTIEGFKSLRHVEDLELKNLNILIGSNGAGKSNFVSYFEMVKEIAERRMQTWVDNQGGANRILSFGVKETPELSSRIEFNSDYYEIKLRAVIGDRVLQIIPHSALDTIPIWRIYYCHDTSETAAIKRPCSLHDNAYLRPDGANLVAFLYRMKFENTDAYHKIIETVRLAIPFFDDFDLDPKRLPTDEQQLWLLWRQKGSDYPFIPHQLSDGSLRFIFLATALMQPNPPSTIIIDEPELGLHPYALTLLAALIRSASERVQVIVSTQSVSLVNEFDVEDLIIVERENGETVFKRLNDDDFKSWLEDYTLGELWQKNILGGRPPQ
jgi:predicted ATPase